MERKSCIWAKMMYGKTQLLDSTSSLKAAALGKPSGGRCSLCRAMPGDTRGDLALLVLRARGSGQGRFGVRAPPAPSFPSLGTVCAAPYHCLSCELSCLCSLGF